MELRANIIGPTSSWISAALMTGQTRRNPLTGQWVIYSPQRGVRPDDYHAYRSAGTAAARPERKPDCPFCPGNEDMLPQPVISLPPGSGDDWQTRVVVNKFPAVSPERGDGLQGRGLFTRGGGHGRHEVIIESPRHDLHPGVMSGPELEAVIRTCWTRFREIARDQRLKSVSIFRNHGASAGASRHHPHSQLLATAFTPPAQARRSTRAGLHLARTGKCLMCDILARELDSGQRLVMDNDRFVALVPFAAAGPFEVWVIPREHQSCFGGPGGEDAADLAAVLGGVLARMHRLLADPDYNYVIHSLPREPSGPDRGRAGPDHWFIQIKPRLTIPAGYELGSDSAINPNLPEEDAGDLRRA